MFVFVHVENDNMALVSALNTNHQNRPATSGLICEMKELLSLAPGFKELKVDRANNFVANASLCGWAV